MTLATKKLPCTAAIHRKAKAVARHMKRNLTQTAEVVFDDYIERHGIPVPGNKPDRAASPSDSAASSAA